MHWTIQPNFVIGDLVLASWFFMHFCHITLVSTKLSFTNAMKSIYGNLYYTSVWLLKLLVQTAAKFKGILQWFYSIFFRTCPNLVVIFWSWHLKCLCRFFTWAKTTQKRKKKGKKTQKTRRVSHWSSKACRFDPHLELRNCFSENKAWWIFNCHSRYLQAPALPKYISQKQGGSFQFACWNH